MASYVWVSERGPGPLVVMRSALRDGWAGVRALAGQQSDYGRACAVGEVGCIDIRGGSALVLGDDPLVTTWLPMKGGGMFVRWIAADDEAAAIAALDAGADATWTPTGCTFTTTGGEHVLFPASASGDDDAAERLAFELREGDYALSSAVLQHDSATVLVYRVTWRPRTKR